MEKIVYKHWWEIYYFLVLEKSAEPSTLLNLQVRANRFLASLLSSKEKLGNRDHE